MLLQRKRTSDPLLLQKSIEKCRDICLCYAIISTRGRRRYTIMSTRGCRRCTTKTDGNVKNCV